MFEEKIREMVKEKYKEKYFNIEFIKDNMYYIERKRSKLSKFVEFKVEEVISKDELAFELVLIEKKFKKCGVERRTFVEKEIEDFFIYI